MARRGTTRTTVNNWSSAIYATIARVAPARPFNIPYVSRVSLLPVEDLRLYHPLGKARAARVVTGVGVGPFVVGREKVSSRRSRFSPGVSFATPGRTIVCIRRKRRREVLFAKGKGGGRTSRYRRRNQWSEIWCSR